MKNKAEMKSFEGSTLKALPNGKIGGYLVLHGDLSTQDLDQQHFTKSTYLGHNEGSGAECVFNHRRNVDTTGYDADTASSLKSLSKRFMTNPIVTRRDDIGLFAEIVMDMSDQYEKAIYDLAANGALKWSAGSAPHLIDVGQDGHIKSFVITEGSLTPSPMEFRMIRHKVKPMKAAVLQRKPREAAQLKSKNWIRSLKGGVGSGNFGHGGLTGVHGGSGEGNSGGSGKTTGSNTLSNYQDDEYDEMEWKANMMDDALRFAANKIGKDISTEAAEDVLDSIDGEVTIKELADQLISNQERYEEWRSERY